MDIDEDFLWHTRRASNYYDAYWQWVKTSHSVLDDCLKPLTHEIFKRVYTYGWQYDMQIITVEEFRKRLREIAKEV